MKEDLVLIGGGGHCRSCIDVIEHLDTYTIVGIIDIAARRGKSVLGYEIIGNDSDLSAIIKKVRNFLITIGQINSCQKRKSMYDMIKILGGTLPTIVSPLAYVSPHAMVEEGTIIMHYATVNAGATVGKNCILNTRSLVEHDVTVGDNCHLSTAATVNGGVCIGSDCFIGSNATVREQVKIGAGCIVGAGSLVLKDLVGQGVYIGAPARRKIDV